MGKISAEPQGAAEMVPRGCDLSGGGIPPVDTYSMITKKSTLDGKYLVAEESTTKCHLQCDVSGK